MKVEIRKHISELLARRLLALSGDTTMGSKICEVCRLMFAYLAVDYCYVAWVIPDGEPQLTEEQVLGVDNRPCETCSEKLKDLGITDPQTIVEHIGSIQFEEVIN